MNFFFVAVNGRYTPAQCASLGFDAATTLAGGYSDYELFQVPNMLLFVF